MQDFRKLRIWQENRQLTKDIYRLTRPFPPEERYGLVAQMRGAVISVGSNIAEGCGRGSRKDSLRILQMAYSSLMELLHQVITSDDLGFLKTDSARLLEQQIESIRRGTAAFMARLRDS